MDACERTGSFAGILCLCSAYFTHMFLYGCIYVYIYEHVCTYMLSGMVVYGSRMQCSAVIWAALLLHCMVFYRHVELYHGTAHTAAGPPAGASLPAAEPDLQPERR